MDAKTIGILGASGYVGGGAVETMSASTGHRTVLGGRNLAKLREKYRDKEGEIDFLYVDVYNGDSLHRFCGQCDIVINCAGPAKQVADRVASAALEQGVHYVDVSGDEHLYRQVLQRKQEIVENQLLFVVSAGVYPGLSEIFPAYVAETYFDEIDSLELFFAGNGGFSLNAAYDIVCSIEEDTGMGMTYCKYGEASKIDRPFHSTYKLPSPAGKRDTYPILHYEFQSTAKKYNFRSAWFYNTYQDKSVLNKFVMIKALQQYQTEEQKRASARMLTEQFGAKQETKEYTMFHLIATGNKNGQTKQLVANLLYPNDWNTLSGIVAAHVARWVIEESCNRYGCFLAAEGINVSNVMELLGEMNTTLTHTFTEIKQG